MLKYFFNFHQIISQAPLPLFLEENKLSGEKCYLNLFPISMIREMIGGGGKGQETAKEGKRKECTVLKQSDQYSSKTDLFHKPTSYKQPVSSYKQKIKTELI